MLNKESISVFNPQDPLEQVVSNSYYAMSGEWLSAGQVKFLIEGVLGYDGLYEEFLTYPEKVCNELFSEGHGDHICIPCYPIELRQILKERKICGGYKIAGLPLLGAKRYLNEYPILLVLDREKLNTKPSFEIAGVSLFGDHIDFGTALIRVLTWERVDSDTSINIEKMVNDEYPNATVHVMTDVPGISVKVAEAPHEHLHKFVVHIPTLDIDEEVLKSSTPELAVDEALVRAWKKTLNPHRDVKYTVEYWKNTPYWGTIVKNAENGGHLDIKTAATWYEEMRNLGEKPKHVSWLCGYVVKRPFGNTNDNISHTLVCDRGTYKLQRDGDKIYDDKELDKWVSKQVCCKGFVHGYVFIASEIKENDTSNPDEDIQYRTEATPKSLTKFEVGDKVRHRHRGIAFAQIDGEVSKIEGNLMFVKWKNLDSEEVFKLDDTVALHGVIEKI